MTWALLIARKVLKWIAEYPVIAGCLAAALLVSAMAAQAAYLRGKIDRIKANHVAEVAELSEDHVAAILIADANLAQSESNSSLLEQTIGNQRIRISSIELEMVRRRTAAEERVRRAQKERRAADAYASELHTRIEAQETCEAQVRVAIAGVWEAIQ